jgi:hypothetical protein
MGSLLGFSTTLFREEGHDHLTRSGMGRPLRVTTYGGGMCKPLRFGTTLTKETGS